MSENGFRTIYVEAPHGARFEAKVECGTPLHQVAADFFESQGWPMQDQNGRGQRAVVDLVNPEKPDETKRLNGDDDICESMVQDNDVLRIFPESVAGAVDQRARINALIADHNEMKALKDRNPKKIDFAANRSHAPDHYHITFTFTSFVGYYPGDPKPITGKHHEAEITLGAEYPRRAPTVVWKTSIFHPNIKPQTGEVCLGVLQDRYLPGLGLARIVSMLMEIIQWRNFDLTNALNKDAVEWAIADDNDHEKYITEIGGHPFQGPVEQLLEKLRRSGRKPIVFEPVE